MSSCLKSCSHLLKVPILLYMGGRQPNKRRGAVWAERELKSQEAAPSSKLVFAISLTRQGWAVIVTQVAGGRRKAFGILIFYWTVLLVQFAGAGSRLVCLGKPPLMLNFSSLPCSAASSCFMERVQLQNKSWAWVLDLSSLLCDLGQMEQFPSLFPHLENVNKTYFGSMQGFNEIVNVLVYLHWSHLDKTS